VFGEISFAYGQSFPPIFPVFVLKKDRYRGSDGYAVMDTRENVNFVGFNLHPPAAAVPLLPTPEFAINELLLDMQSSRHT
jgi:hypothetical protein